jgi:Domain of unknown function (DUF1918)
MPAWQEAAILGLRFKRNEVVMSEQTLAWKAGDVLIVEGRNTNAAARKGEILQVLGEPSHPHFSVRWDDGHETIFYPALDVTLRHAQTHR